MLTSILNKGALVMGILFLMFNYGSADQESISTLDSSSEETQDKIKELEKRAEIYREIINIKQKQTASLDNQLTIMNSDIQQVEVQMEINKRRIKELNNQITKLEKQIKEKDAKITSQKKLLANLIQTYYEANNTNLVTVYLNEGNLASFMVTKDRIAQTGDKIKNLVNSLLELKKNLEQQISEIEINRAEIVNTHAKLEDQSVDLEVTKKQKENLLAQTKGEEAKYSELLARVEQQKQELLDIDQFFAASGLSTDDYPKPPSSMNASLSWYYSQRDSRWADKKIGNSNSTLKAYGCAVASVAMVFTKHGDTITPASLAKKDIFSWDLIAWPNSWPSAELTMSGDGKSHGNINWSVIDDQLEKNNPVIVYIKKTNGSGGHYVVIHHKQKAGKYVVHDPYFGPNIYLDTSRALVGAMGSRSGTAVDQMIIYN